MLSTNDPISPAQQHVHSTSMEVEARCILAHPQFCYYLFTHPATPHTHIINWSIDFQSWESRDYREHEERTSLPSLFQNFRA